MTTVTSFKPEGFVLVAVIWVLAAMSLLAGYIATQLQGVQDSSFVREQQRIDALDRLAVESVVLYLASTRTATQGGILTDLYAPREVNPFEASNLFVPRGDELRLDGRAYKVRGGHQLRIQDAGSLISLRSETLVRLEHLLAEYDLSRMQRERLVATLMDYTDRDSTPGLNGAERGGYGADLPPTNRFLTNPMQLHNVSGWSRYLEAMPGFFDEVTIYVGDRENYNTMRPSGMRAVGLEDASEITRIIEHRERSPYGDMAEVLEVTGQVFTRDEMAVTFLPSRYLRLRLNKAGESIEHWIGVTLTPNSNLSPWEIDYRLRGRFSDNGHGLTGHNSPTTLL